jgi:hypothetical protein
MRSVMAAGALLAVVLGAMVVTSRGTDRAPPPHPAKITSGGLEVRVPPDWSRTHRVPALPDFGFTSPIVLVDEAFGTLLVADRLPASSRSLLPAPVLRRLLRSAPRAQPMHLGGALRGFAYMRLAAGDVEGVSDVYVAPTSQGIVTVLCLAKDQFAAHLSECGRIAASVSATRAVAIPPAPTAALQERLKPLMAGVDRSRKAANRALAVAGTPSAQARPFDAMARTTAAAAVTLERLAPPRPAWPRQIVSAIRAVSRSYRRVRDALLADDPARYAAAAVRLRRDEERVRRLLASTQRG